MGATAMNGIPIPPEGGAAPVLEARAVTAGYGGLAAIREVSLEVRPGEIVALLGANGAGKTTTILTLCGELTPMSGEVCFLGEPTRALVDPTGA